MSVKQLTDCFKYIPKTNCTSLLMRLLEFSLTFVANILFLMENSGLEQKGV